MATLNTYALTLADMMKATMPDGKFDPNIIQLMLETNEILDDIPFVEANQGITHVTTLNTKCHKPTWVALGEGVKADKTQYNQIKASCGRMKSRVEIDGDTYDENVQIHGKNSDQVKALVDREIRAAAEGMRDEMAKAYFYGDVGDEPRSFNGLGKVFAKYGVGNDLSVSASCDDKDAAFYCINAAKTSSPSTSALRSIYYIGWGPDTVHGIYPGGNSGSALKTDPLTKETVRDANDKVRNVYGAFLHWNSGICVRDFRYAGRICNIESDYLLASSGQPAYLEFLDYFEMLPKHDKGTRGALYMAPSVWRALRILFGRATRSNAIRYEDVEQRKKVPMLFGTPVRLCDALEVNEDQVSSI